MKKVCLIVILLIFKISLFGEQIVKPDIELKNEIYYAVLNSDIAKVSLLLKKDPALINTIGPNKLNLLVRAMYVRNSQMIEFLIKNGLKNKVDQALHTAVSVSWFDMVKMLVEKYEANVNKLGRRGSSALSSAIHRRNKEITYYLMDKGATIKIGPGNINWVVANALKSGMDRVLVLVDKSGITLDLSSKSQSGETFLHNAASGGMVKFGKKIFKKEPKLNTVNNYGWAPIHIAAKNGYQKFIKMLLKYGIDKNSRTLNGKSVYNIALENRHIKLCRFFGR